MADTWRIETDKISSAIFGGFADKSFVNEEFQGKKIPSLIAKSLLKKIQGGYEFAKAKVKAGWNFFAQWWTDDPVGATAGAIAATLALGVVVVVGAEVIGALVGGIAGLASLNLIELGTVALQGLLVAGTIGSLLRFAIRGVQFLWRFNFNITDKQIVAQQKSLIDSLYGQAGSTIGSAIGSLFCGAAPVEFLKRNKLVKVNPVMLAKLREVSKFDPHSDEYGEIYEEVMENAKALVNAGTRVASQWIFLESYKNVRKWIKAGSNAINLKKFLPGLDNIIQKWGEEGSQPWSFASAMEEAIESIDDQRLQTFTEELVESFMESCTESAMVISYAL